MGILKRSSPENSSTRPRVQVGTSFIDYVSVGTALQDAVSRQNHAIFARRGCGKTLLLHHSARNLSDAQSKTRVIYLNCEDFKRHTFPNVLIEILVSIFSEMRKNISGWFGKKARNAAMLDSITSKLNLMKVSPDNQSEDVKTKQQNDLSGKALVDLTKFEQKVGGEVSAKTSRETERSFKVHRDKLSELDNWLPDLKKTVREFFDLSSRVDCVLIQIDDFYHLRRSDQAFVIDYIHRLCKDVPIFFKLATLRHSSTLYADGEGQPIGAQERHDYQPINIDYTFSDFAKTSAQNKAILEQFGAKVGLDRDEIKALFRGEGFDRLVMAGGGVPRDVLSLFIELLNDCVIEGDKAIGKDEVRLMSKQNFERKIEELKEDSKVEEQGDLIKGIYIIREFCLNKQSNIFLVSEHLLRQSDEWKALIYRLLDYRIIHTCATALTHKSTAGTYHAFAVDIGCYAHMRKLDQRFNEIDVSRKDCKERMRSAPILGESDLKHLASTMPSDVETALMLPGS